MTFYNVNENKEVEVDDRIVDVIRSNERERICNEIKEHCGVQRYLLPEGVWKILEGFQGYSMNEHTIETLRAFNRYLNWLNTEGGFDEAIKSAEADLDTELVVVKTRGQLGEEHVFHLRLSNGTLTIRNVNEDDVLDMLVELGEINERDVRYFKTGRRN